MKRRLQIDVRLCVDSTESPRSILRRLADQLGDQQTTAAVVNDAGDPVGVCLVTMLAPPAPASRRAIPRSRKISPRETRRIS